MTASALETKQSEEVVKEEANLPVFLPDVDIHTDESYVYLAADLPGVNAENLDISIENRVLTIYGKQHIEVAHGRVYHKEYRNGHYKRSFTLNDTLDAEKIEADLQNGVLYVKIPKRKPEVKKITVRS
ncbi:MAG: Hsp20/alpha crystallin family protein [Spirochaetota bacterium]